MEMIIDQYRGVVAEEFEVITSQFIFEEAIAHSFDSCVIMPNQPDLPIIYVNQSFCRMTGYAFEEVLGKNMNFLNGPRTNFGLYRLLETKPDDADFVCGETINYRKCDDEFYMQWRILPFRDYDGRVSHFLMMMRDVTDLRVRQN
jgi:PAS domain S-box-containing protein